VLGQGQNHLAVAGGYEVKALTNFGIACGAPTRYREVVLTLPKVSVLVLKLVDTFR